MTIFQAFAVLISLTALFGFINERYIKLPTPIGVMLVSLIISLGLVFAGLNGVEIWAINFLQQLDFNDLVMEGMLSFLLFAGSLHVNLEDLNKQKVTILTLATLGVLLSTFVVGTFLYFSLPLLGISIPFIYALLFGSLISPTDPIAVLGILKQARVPKTLETLITGESLFNDGVGVVVFSVILGIATASGHGEASLSGVAVLFAQEALGGVVYGLALGLVSYLLLKRIDNYTVEVLITLATVAGGYALALALHTSGPLAMVIAGLFIGNRGRLLAMSDTTREHLDTFWELLDQILNSVLFVLIGLEIIVITFTGSYLGAAILAIPLVLLSRFISVGLPINVLRLRTSFARYTVRMMTWGGLRGGISIALALSIPAGAERDVLIAMTYGVVIFAILVQGLTVGRVAKMTQADKRQGQLNA